MTPAHGPLRSTPRTLRPLAAVVLAAGLAGCISIFPKERPVQLYRFGVPAATIAAEPAAPGPAFLVRATIGAFDRASAGDRILTVRGQETAYIASARWVEPAIVLIGEAMRRSFETTPGATLLGGGDLAAADARLALDVQTFEVRFAPGAGKAPVVVVRIAADLEGARPPFARSRRLFDIETPARGDTLGAIVEAFDTAVTEALGQIVAWTNASRPPA